MPIQAVLFDLDGTLLDTLQDLANAGNYTLSALGLPTHPVEAYRSMVGSGVKKLVERMLPENQRGEATASLALSLFQKRYAAHMLDCTVPYPGIVELLHALRQLCLPLGVASNKDDGFVQEMAARYFPGTFTAVTGFRPDFLPKPDPALVLQLAASLGATAKHVLYVGDSDVDMLTARNAGFIPCGVSWGFRTRAELEQAGAAYMVDDALELVALVKEWPDILDG